MGNDSVPLRRIGYFNSFEWTSTAFVGSMTGKLLFTMFEKTHATIEMSISVTPPLLRPHLDRLLVLSSIFSLYRKLTANQPAFYDFCA